MKTYIRNGVINEMAKRVKSIADLRKAGLAPEDNTKKVSGEFHHFKYTEKRAREIGLYDTIGSRAPKEVENWVFYVVNGLNKGTLELVVKE